MEFKGTKGKWKLSNNDTTGKTEKPTIKGDERMVCMLPPLSPDHEANAKLIACAPELLDMLDEARLQIEYLHGKFGQTGSGNNVLSRINELIKRITE